MVFLPFSLVLCIDTPSYIYLWLGALHLNSVNRGRNLVCDVCLFAFHVTGNTVGHAYYIKEVYSTVSSVVNFPNSVSFDKVDVIDGSSHAWILFSIYQHSLGITIF